ncbi:lipid-A-disaccharide synthase [Candidatus Desantisbacteria bacterium]|nr:lipid-A-disaccharide synthase [Candidatus Desantisbacteria bacterium]
MSNLKFLIIAGEDSGDLHGASLAENIFKYEHGAHISGIGGQRMKACGVDILFDIKSMGLMGVTEIFGKIRIIREALKKIEEKLINNPPDAVILIDYPGFNLKIAKIAHRLSIPVIYYICPQIWAWAPNRIKKIAAWVTKVIVIFDFEKKLYEKAGIPVEFVGHPLLDTIKIETDRETALKYFNMEDAKRVVTLMPGSRMSEIKYHMPILIQTAKLIFEKLPHTKFIIPCASGIDMEILGGYIIKSGLPIRVIKGKNYDVLNVSDFSIVASGTATLEVAYFEKPMIILYKTSFINWFLSRIFMITPYFGLVNILAGEEIVPEYLQYEINPKILAEHVILT